MAPFLYMLSEPGYAAAQVDTHPDMTLDVASV